MEPLDDFEIRPSGNSKFWGHVFFSIALLTATWFFTTSWIWVYLLNLVFSYPIGLLSLLFWALGRNFDPNYRRYRYIVWILICGLLFSIIALFIMLALG